MNDINSLAHTKWNCKYHIVFAPKYRRKVFFGEKRREIGKILRQLCAWKKVTIVEAEVCSDHIHMLLEIPPKIAVSSFVGYLKGKSSLMMSVTARAVYRPHRRSRFTSILSGDSFLRRLEKWSLPQRN